MQGNGGYRLIVRRGPQPNQSYDLNKETIALGRDITNDIVINDPEVSRHHCRITRTPTGYAIEDLGSTNGTFVNGQRLTGSRQLVNGDMIGLGETVTLGYEGGAVQPAGPSPQHETVVGASAPSPQPYTPPAQPQQGYPQQQPAPQQEQQPFGAQQQPQYAAPAQPYAQQDYYEYDEEPQRGLGRWFAVGCGCLAVVFIVAMAVIVFLIDAMNLWCSVPLVPQLFDLQCPSLLLPMILPFL